MCSTRTIAIYFSLGQSVECPLNYNAQRDWQRVTYLVGRVHGGRDGGDGFDERPPPVSLRELIRTHRFTFREKEEDEEKDNSFTRMNG